jgi:endonuclease/exonuclease/phosphatase family metal-dependent hydrolase
MLTVAIMVSVTSCNGKDVPTPIVPDVNNKEKYILVNEKESRDFTLVITANIPVVFDLPEWIKEKNGNASAIGKKTYSFQAETLPEGIKTRTGDLTVKSADASFGVSIAIPVKQSSEISKFRIATYNILYTKNTWTSGRNNLVVNLIQKYDFDIFGVQEAYYDPHLLSIISNGTYAHKGVANQNGLDGAGGVGWQTPIVYKKERFELLTSGVFWYSQTPGIPSKGWDGINNYCICTWAKFKDKVSGREFYFFNSHFESGDAPIARLESARLLLSKIKEIAGDLPVFATGDFNTSATSEPIKTILNDGLLYDAYALTETIPTGTTGTYTGNSTTPSTSRIDFIFITKDIRVKEYGVINDRPDGQFPSDHDPVTIVAEF